MAATEANNKPVRRNDGQRWEHCAESFLTARGLRCVARNHHCRGGEIDLVMLVDELLVFVEVRYRRNARYGSAVESVDARKQGRIIFAAQDFLMRHQEFAERACRFDVVALHGDVSAPGCDWIAGAFSA